MRMKEDHMMNGQLKPAYNLQHGVDAEYITWLTLSSKPGDTTTLKPFLKEMEEYLEFKYTKIVADAGYESEENYKFIEANNQIAFIKPMNYEISKTRKYKTDISHFDNMDYEDETDSFICKNGKNLIQAEGSFAQIKEDMGFRRYLSRGKENVLTESILLALGHNINKLHNKIQGNRCGHHLHKLKKCS